MWLLITDVVASAAVGALVGRLMRCQSGACIMFTTWKRGMVVGAVIGLLNGLQFLK